MCSADFRHPPIVLSILPSRRILTFLKWFQGVAYTGRGSRETCPTGGAIWDDWAARKLQPWWCVLLFPHIPSMRNTYCFWWWWWWWGGQKLSDLWSVGKKNLRDSRGQIGHLKTPTLSGTSVMMDILIVVHTLSRRQEESNADVMLLFISEGGYSENYHQIVPGLHHHFIRKSPLFLNSKHWFPELKHNTISRRLNANHDLLLLRPTLR